MSEKRRTADVYVRITVPDDYRDVHPDLVIEDAIPHTAFEIENATSEVAALREALRSLARIETDDDGLPVLVISCGWHCQTSDQTELPLVWAALSRLALTGNGEKP